MDNQLNNQSSPKKQLSQRILSKNETKDRRDNMILKTFELKIDKSKLPEHTKKELELLFLEAKWTYNYYLSLFKDQMSKWTKNTANIVNPVDTKKNKVIVLNKDREPEERVLTVLSSQMKQSILQKIWENFKSLKALRSEGFKTGKLKFKSQINSIILKQFDVTYKLVQIHKANKEGENTRAFLDKNYKINIQGIKGKFRVNGLNQIEKFSYYAKDPLDKNKEKRKRHIEFGQGKLIKRGNNYYLHIVCYADKDIESDKRRFEEIKDKSIGIDFGCETPLTLSVGMEDGIKINYNIPINKQLRKAHKKLSKKQKFRIEKFGKKSSRKKSKNEQKCQNKLNILYKRNTHKKEDIKNKLVRVLTNSAQYIIFQDENIAGWQGSGHGKKINQTAIGGITKDLKTKSHTPEVIEPSYPSTKLCPCGYKLSKEEIREWDRTFICPKCGYTLDRDWKSSRSLESEGLERIDDRIKEKEIPTERRNFKPVEMRAAATKLLDSLNGIHGVSCKLLSLRQEAQVL